MNKNKVVDDISENLKQTMRRIDELDNDKEESNDRIENQTSHNNFFKSSKLSLTKNKFPQSANDFQSRLSGFKNLTQSPLKTNESFQNSKVVYNNKRTMNNSNSYVDNNNGFKVYSQNIIKNLDNLYNDINKDFSELENFIQSSMQH